MWGIIPVVEIYKLSTISISKLALNRTQFDATRIYAEGFSQNSMFSAHIGHCYQDRVLGIWQGGSGMSLTGQRPYTPGIIIPHITNTKLDKIITYCMFIWLVIFECLLSYAVVLDIFNYGSCDVIEE